MTKVFISYKREDTQTSSLFIELLERRLVDAGINPSRDTQIIPGTNWEEYIDTEIDNCFALLLIVTQQATQSQYVTYEWTRALSKGKAVIPLRIDSFAEIHPRLEKLQFSDFTQITQNSEKWDQLIETLDLLRKMHEDEQNLRNLQNSSEELFELLSNLYEKHRLDEVTTENVISELRAKNLLSLQRHAQLLDIVNENRLKARKAT